jgi:hypothetical protein
VRRFFDFLDFLVVEEEDVDAGDSFLYNFAAALSASLNLYEGSFFCPSLKTFVAKSVQAVIILLIKKIYISIKLIYIC